MNPRRHDARTELPQIKADYSDLGFALVRDLFPADLRRCFIDALETIQRDVATLKERHGPLLVLERDLPAHRRGGVPAGDVGNALFLINDLLLITPIFLAFPQAPGLATLVSHVLDLAEPELHYTNATIKQPRFGRSIAWHRDFPNRYICPPDGRFMRLMLCLDGMDEISGATMLLPGSHLLPFDPPDDPEAIHRFAEAHGAEAVALCCAPGDVVLIHPKILHGGGMNISARPRRNLILQAGSSPPEGPNRESRTGHRLAAL